MRKTPGELLRKSLGDLDRVVVLGVEYILSEEIAIPHAADMEDLVYENAEVVAKWARIVARCRNQVNRAEDDLEELKATYMVAYWEELEKKERDEMAAQLDDETEVAQDRADKAAGDEGWKMRRSTRRASRVTSGVAAGRWRRNFSDDLLRAHVNRTPEIITSKKAKRQADSQLQIAEGILKSVTQRAYSISNLCNIHRDNSRR